VLDYNRGTEKLVAAARLTKEHGRNSAEFSVLVADDYQGEGIGEKLLTDLIDHAKTEGLDAIEAVVLRTNGAMIHVAEKAGFECVYDEEENVVRQYLNLNDCMSKVEEDMIVCPISAPIDI